MSAILIRVFAEGIVFGADRNVTVDGKCDGTVTVPKICKSRDSRVLIGNIGVTNLGGFNALDQIKEVVDSFEGERLSKIAKEVQSGVYQQRLIDDRGKKIRPQIVSIAGYEERDGAVVPECWYISNCYELDEYGDYKDYRSEFGCSDEVRIKTLELNITSGVLRERLRGVNGQGYIGFQHSIDLSQFNVLTKFTKGAIDKLYELDSTLLPKTIEDHARPVELALHMFGAFYRVFKPADSQFVGGGADVEVLPWD